MSYLRFRNNVRPAVTVDGVSTGLCNPGFETDFGGASYSGGTQIPIWNTSSTAEFQWRDGTALGSTPCWGSASIESPPISGNSWYRSTAAPRSGSAHAAVELDATAQLALYAFGVSIPADAAFYTDTCSPGDTIDWSIWFRRASGSAVSGEEGIAVVVFYSAAHAYLADSSVVTSGLDTTYAEAAVTAVAPASAAYVLCGGYFEGSGSGSTMYADDATLAIT